MIYSVFSVLVLVFVRRYAKTVFYIFTMQGSRATSTDMFVSIVRKYTRARKLTPRMLNELVEKIEVYNAEKIDGEWVQRLRIHYTCVGEMNIPNEPALPIPAGH